MSETTDHIIDKLMEFEAHYDAHVSPVGQTKVGIGTVTHRMINRQCVTGIAIQDQIRLQQHLDHERNQLLPKTPGTVGPKNAARAFQYGLRPGHWRTADATVVQMSHMSEDHLSNALRLAKEMGHDIKCLELINEIEWRMSLPLFDR